MNKISILETAQAIIDMSNEIESLKTENVNLRDRLIHAQSETLAAIQQNEPKPEPRDIGHENIVSFVTRKSGELQVSPGIVWGLVMDLIAKNPNHFGTDADACPDPVENACDQIFETASVVDKHEYKIGDKVRILEGESKGQIGTIINVDSTLNFPFLVKTETIHCPYDATEIEPYTEPIPEPGDDSEPFEFRVGDVVRTEKGFVSEIINYRYFGKHGTKLFQLKGTVARWFPDELEFVSRP
jgi:transcription antitermination factor NusG